MQKTTCACHVNSLATNCFGSRRAHIDTARTAEWPSACVAGCIHCPPPWRSSECRDNRPVDVSCPGRIPCCTVWVSASMIKMWNEVGKLRVLTCFHFPTFHTYTGLVMRLFSLTTGRCLHWVHRCITAGFFFSSQLWSFMKLPVWSSQLTCRICTQSELHTPQSPYTQLGQGKLLQSIVSKGLSWGLQFSFSTRTPLSSSHTTCRRFLPPPQDLEHY